MLDPLELENAFKSSMIFDVLHEDYKLLDDPDHSNEFRPHSHSPHGSLFARYFAVSIKPPPHQNYSHTHDAAAKRNAHQTPWSHTNCHDAGIKPFARETRPQLHYQKNYVAYTKQTALSSEINEFFNYFAFCHDNTKHTTHGKTSPEETKLELHLYKTKLEQTREQKTLRSCTLKSEYKNTPLDYVINNFQNTHLHDCNEA